MKLILGLIACLTFSATAWSEQTVAEFKWNQIPPDKCNEYQKVCKQLDALRTEEQGLLTKYNANNPRVQSTQAQIDQGEINKKQLEEKFPGMIALLRRGFVPVLVDGREVLTIENTNDAPLQLALLTIEKPKVSALMYAVQGEIRYDAVKGDGFLEMWNYFPPVKPGLPEGEYFSRTLGESGEMGKISGTSDWRLFSLPFDSTGASGSPTRLQINLILKGRGTVYLGPIKLVQYPVAKSAVYGGSENAWWSDSAAGLVGGWGGSIIGCLGGLIGVLCSMGKGRGLVIALLRIMTGLGIVCGMAGIVALVQHQPYGVWYPLVLPGVLLLALCPTMLPTVRRRYQEHELRRMQALDASG